MRVQQGELSPLLLCTPFPTTACFPAVSLIGRVPIGMLCGYCTEYTSVVLPLILSGNFSVNFADESSEHLIKFLRDTRIVQKKQTRLFCAVVTASPWQRNVYIVYVLVTRLSKTFGLCSILSVVTGLKNGINDKKSVQR